MGKIKPIYVMNQEGLINLERQAILEGIKDLIWISEALEIGVSYLDVWRNNNFKNEDGSLKPFQSVDWYIQRGRETSSNKKQLNADTMQHYVVCEPWRDPKKGGRDHYDILVVRDDMYSRDTNFVIGLAIEGLGAVISTHRFKTLGDKTRYECIKTETMHELGHVFGLIPDSRTENVEYSLGKHCANICIMRQGLTLPADWINISNDRIQHGALCSTCEQDLRNYFRK